MTPYSRLRDKYDSHYERFVTDATHFDILKKIYIIRSAIYSVADEMTHTRMMRQLSGGVIPQCRQYSFTDSRYTQTSSQFTSYLLAVL